MEVEFDWRFPCLDFFLHLLQEDAPFLLGPVSSDHNFGESGESSIGIAFWYTGVVRQACGHAWSALVWKKKGAIKKMTCETHVYCNFIRCPFPYTLQLPKNMCTMEITKLLETAPIGGAWPWLLLFVYPHVPAVLLLWPSLFHLLALLLGESILQKHNVGLAKLLEG